MERLEGVAEQVDALFEASDSILHDLFARMMAEPEPPTEQPA